jgi:hemerythrin-like domain-containing protein
MERDVPDPVQEDRTMKSIDLLLEDHRHLLLASGILDEMAASVERGQAVREADLEDLLRFFEEFGDRHHQGVEEGVLFPALLLDPAQKHYQRLHGLVFEHERQRSLIDGLYDSLVTKSIKDFSYCARRFSDLLRRHIKEEEETFFPLVKSTLSVEDDHRVEQQMKAYDKSWQESALGSHLQRLSAMESKYLPAPNARKA